MTTVTLGEVAEWGSGGTPRRGVAKYFGEGTPWLSIADLNDGVVNSAKESLTPAGLASSSAKMVPPGTLFVAMYGSIGKLGIAGKEMATSQAIAFAKPNERVVDRRFLFHFLLAERPKFQALGRGGTQMNIGQGDLKSWPIWLPSLLEQRRIAAILDHADALRTKRRQALSLTDTLSEAVFYRQFGTDLDRRPLGDSLRFVTSGGRGWAKYYSASGARFIQSLDVQMGTISNRDPVFVKPPNNAEARRTRTIEGDVLLTITGSRIGRVAALPPSLAGSYVSQHVAILRPDPEVMLPEFLSPMLGLPGLGQRLIAGAQYGQTKPGLNFEQIRSFPLPQPSISRQHAFIAKLKLVGAQRTRMQQAQDRVSDLFASLQSRAFEGEL